MKNFSPPGNESSFLPVAYCLLPVAYFQVKHPETLKTEQL